MSDEVEATEDREAFKVHNTFRGATLFKSNFWDVIKERGENSSMLCIPHKANDGVLAMLIPREFGRIVQETAQMTNRPEARCFSPRSVSLDNRLYHIVIDSDANNTLAPLIDFLIEPQLAIGVSSNHDVLYIYSKPGAPIAICLLTMVESNDDVFKSSKDDALRQSAAIH